MIRLLARFSAIALIAVSAYAQLPNASPFGLSAPQDTPKVKLKISFDKASYAPNDAVHGVVEAAIEPGWHINSNKPLEDFAIPSTVEIKSSSLRVDKTEWPPHEEKALGFANGAKLAVFEGTIKLPFTGVALAGGDGAVHVKMHYQSCNDSVCLRPADATLDDKIVVRGGAATPTSTAPSTTPAVQTTTTSSAAPAVQTPATAPSAASPVQTQTSFTKLSDAPKEGKTSLFSGDIAGIFRTRGLLLTFLTIFVVGLLLNLTPCVYPLIPITLAFFASQTEGRKSRQVALASSYVGGLVIMYAALGAAAALTGSLFGAWLQSPSVLIFFAVLMLVLASSMFGLFEFRVPHFISDRAGAKSGYGGALVMGLFAGIVAAPCVGPVVVSLIGLVGQLHRPVLGTAMFVVLALGLGFPYLVGLSSLPRSGAWMVTIKKALGFVLIAMAFYFLRGVAGELVFRWGVAASLVLGAVFLFVLRKNAGAGKKLSYGLAILLLLGGFAFAPKKHEGAEMTWEPYSEARLASAKAAGKPVVIDFFADWCIPCKELDAKTFSDRSVQSEAERFVRLKADLTSSDDPTVKALSQHFQIVGVPTIVFIGADGKETTAVRLTGFEAPDKFLQRLEQVR